MKSQMPLRLAACLVASLPAFALAAQPAAVVPPDNPAGIAAKYPGDQAIRQDPAVVFAADFDDCATPADLCKTWDFVWHDQHMRLAPDPARGKVLECTVPKNSELSVGLGKTLARQHDCLFMRFLWKLGDGFDVTGAKSCHNGATLAARYYLNGNATPGKRADGHNKFLVNCEAESVYSGPDTPSPGKLNFYCYHPAQRDDFGDHIFPTGVIMPNTSRPGDFGPGFTPRPDFVPRLGRWYCIEFMVKANTPGKRDGRIACWVDNQLVANLPGMRLRDVGSLKIDHLGIGLYIANATTRDNRAYYDNIVAATSRVGPVADKK